MFRVFGAVDWSFQDILSYVLLGLAFLYFRNAFEKKGAKETPPDKSKSGHKSGRKRELTQQKDEAELVIVQQPPPFTPALRKQPGRFATEEYLVESAMEKKPLKKTFQPKKVPVGLPVKHVHLHADEEKDGALPSRARLAINRLSRLSDLVIYKEIIGKPKGLEK